MAEDMQIELLGGPADGITLTVPDYAKVWIVEQMPVGAQSLLAIAEQAPESPLPTDQHIYVWTKRFSRNTLYRIFHYSGVRPRG